jgi:hypothetical protein
MHPNGSVKDAGETIDVRHLARLPLATRLDGLRIELDGLLPERDALRDQIELPSDGISAQFRLRGMISASCRLGW